MIAIKLTIAKISFKPQSVLNAVERAQVRYVSRAGAFIRSDARRSIRKRKRPAPAGKPPRSVTGTLKAFIKFAVDKRHPINVVVGPELLANQRDSQKTLELGGSVRRSVFERGGRNERTVFYKARPYMGPAYEKTEPDLPGLFATAFSK